MRVTVGAIAVLGLAVTVATAQPGRERAAVLRAPQPLAPDELPSVARGAAESFPSPALASTPVPRSTGPVARAAASTGPAWLTGADPNLMPAAGSASKTGAVRPLTPPAPLSRDDSGSPPPKMLDRLKIFPGDKPPPAPVPQPIAQVPAEQPQPTAATPFRGTGANGAPVYAGPPAYRWYGWGSVTPGANPLAPAGQYPKASANWYSITGATPGAFPVPVANSGRIVPGTEPPTYGLAARTQVPAPVVPIVPQPQPAHVFTDRSEGSKFGPPPSAGAVPPHTFAPPSVPTFSPPPIAKPAAVAPVVLPPPAMPIAPGAGAPRMPSEPVAALPPMPPVPALPPVPPGPSPAPPVAPIEPAKPALTTGDPKSISVTPAPLPTSVTADPPREEPKWQQSSDPAAPRPGTWAPAPSATPLPTAPPAPAQQAPDWQTGRTKTEPVIRAQKPDNTPDPITTLVKQACQGRAEGVEIRWTGTKKLQVCFEVRTSEAAQKLVADISKRAELTAYQIDFCVVVK